MLIAFVIGHLLGNLQFFAGPHVINEYGTKLRHLPFGGLWVVRPGEELQVAKQVPDDECDEHYAGDGDEEFLPDGRLKK